jgi:hypothetical protein
VSDDFAVPPSPDGRPAPQARREDFRAPTPPRRRGRFPRWVAILLGLGGIVIIASVAAQVTLRARDANLEPAEPDATGRLHSAQLVAGMCIEEIGDEPSQVLVVDCSEPHSAEVATVVTLSGEEFPGAAGIATEVLDYCASQLAPGGPLAEEVGGREWVAWVPSARTWSSGDRSGLCIVTDATPWTGPLAPTEGHAEA